MTDDDRRQFEAEVRRRYDRAGLVAALGPDGEAMATVADAAPDLSFEQCDALRRAYRRMEDAAREAGTWPEVERSYEYLRPWPFHPPDLMAFDGWSRNTFGYAGLVARERAASLGVTDFVAVERAAEGVVMAMEVELARRCGAYSPISPEAAAFLRRPWDEVMGAPSAPAPGPHAGEARGTGPAAAVSPPVPPAAGR